MCFFLNQYKLWPFSCEQPGASGTSEVFERSEEDQWKLCYSSEKRLAWSLCLIYCYSLRKPEITPEKGKEKKKGLQSGSSLTTGEWVPGRQLARQNRSDRSERLGSPGQYNITLGLAKATNPREPTVHVHSEAEREELLNWNWSSFWLINNIALSHWIAYISLGKGNVFIGGELEKQV